MSPDELRNCIDALVKLHGSYRAAAAATGLASPYLNRLRNGQHPKPSASTLAKLRPVQLGRV